MENNNKRNKNALKKSFGAKDCSLKYGGEIESPWAEAGTEWMPTGALEA